MDLPSQPPASRRPGARRAARLPVVALTTLTLLLTAGLSPATATEGQWLNEGGPARSAEAMASDWFRGDNYQFVRGEDNQIWWRYANGSWRVMPGNGRTHHRPEVTVIEDEAGPHLVVFHTGDNGEVYYSLLGGAAGNIWSPWTQLGHVGTSNGISAAGFRNSARLTTVVGDRVWVAEMTMSNGRVTTGPYWRPQTHPRVFTASRYIHAPIITNDGVSIAREVELMDAIIGWDRNVWISHTSLDNFTNATYAAVPGNAQCESVSLGRGGPEQLVTDRNNPAWRAQRNVVLGCISPNDHQLWLNRSTDGGYTWQGWNHSTGGPSPSDAAPSIEGAPGGEVFAGISWGNDTAPFSRHMVVNKRVL
ncbi:hypothetical protein [Streptomyces stackebrandtii]|uniref:hypothetical protein n=1 Tax=Streptomyces stackebrandtii TaxID=3051177 RepID=UPI0028DC5645|nr:hypothetical protein [Streptomyces sp. DSM 40976]